MSKSNQLKSKMLLPSLLIAILSCTAMPAYAYLDPGTGSLIIQSIIGAIAAIGVTMKLYWHKIKLMFGGGRKKDSDAIANKSEDSSAE